MAQTHTDSRDLIASYLSGNLSDADHARFEALWIANPRLIHEIDEVARLQDGLQALRERGELEPLLQRSWWRGTLRFMAMAAGVAALAVGSWTWFMRSEPAPLRIADAATRLAPALVSTDAAPRYFMTLRSAAANDMVVVQPATPTLLHWRLLADGAATAARYEVTLRQLDAGPGRAATLALAPAEDGFLDLYLDSRSLTGGRYVLAVSADGVATGEFRIVVRPEATGR